MGKAVIFKRYAGKGVHILCNAVGCSVYQPVEFNKVFARRLN